MAWRIDETNPVSRVLEEFLAGLPRFQDARFALDAELLLETATARDKLDELCRMVRVPVRF